MLRNEPPAIRPDAPPPAGDTRHAIGLAFGFAVVAIAVAIVALLLTLTNDEGTVAGTTTSPPATPTTATTATTGPTTTAGTATSASPTTTNSTTATTDSTSTSSTITTTDPSTTSQPSQPDPVRTAVWPDATTNARFVDPVVAARSFASGYLGMDDPEIGEFQQGDSRSGEIEIRAELDGPVTTVLLRQLDATDSWWVIGSVAVEVTVDQPDVLAEVTAPLIVSGEADIAGGGELVFEVRADGGPDPIAATTMSAAAGEPSLFRVQLPWDDPGADWGALVILTRNDDDLITGGRVTRVRFTSNGAP